MDIGALVQQSAHRFGDDLALAVSSPEGIERHSFRSIDRASNRVANGLLTAGISPGEPVAILSHNSMPFFETFFATQKIGVPVVPINVRFDASDVEQVVEETRPAAVVVQPDLLAGLNGSDEIFDDADSKVFVTDEHDSYRAFAGLTDAAPDPPGIDVDETTVDGYFYTSGKTGRPKGVVHTHGDRVFTNANLIAEFGLRHSDVNVEPFPMFHSGPLYTGLTPFFQFGVPTILLERFDARQTLAAVDEFGGTVLGGAPTMLDRIAEAAADGRHDLDSLRFWWVSGAPLTAETRTRCQNRLCEQFSIVYGATEIGPPVSTLPPEKSDDHPGSCGTGHMGQRIRIVDTGGGRDPDATLEPGEAGELIVSGESVMDRYLNRPEKTEQVLVDDWYFTGDIARRDEDGYLSIEGRADDMIISGGENIYPSEVESVLQGHPEIQDVVVLGVEDEQWGQTPKAFVVTEADLDTETVVEFCRESELADYKRPRRVAFVDEIPRNPGGGSVLTGDLRAMA
jgi:long-chain acyl-CoA synthetase